MTQEILEDRLINFASQCMNICDLLPLKKLGNAQLSNQLFRSSTSILANYAEASQAESRKDFIHKMKISVKELTESRAWIKLLVASGRIQKNQAKPILEEATQLVKILGAGIATAKARLDKGEA